VISSWIDVGWFGVSYRRLGSTRDTAEKSRRANLSLTSLPSSGIDAVPHTSHHTPATRSRTRPLVSPRAKSRWAGLRPAPQSGQGFEAGCAELRKPALRISIPSMAQARHSSIALQRVGSGSTDGANDSEHARQTAPGMRRSRTSPARRQSTGASTQQSCGHGPALGLMLTYQRRRGTLSSYPPGPRRRPSRNSHLALITPSAS
jgi:hypothetical protein